MQEDKAPLVMFEEHGRIAVGNIHGSRMVDALNVAEFGAEILGFITEPSRRYLLLDFSQVDYLSSTVLTELLRIQNVLHERNGDVRLCAMPPAVQEVFEITHLNTVFTIYNASQQNALQRFDRSLDIDEQEKGWHLLVEEDC